MNKYNPFSKNP